MFCAVWIIYAADRLLDSRNNSFALEPRHHFHHRHRRAFRKAIACVAIALALLTPAIPPAQFRLDLLLAAALILWLLAIHTLRRPLPKALLVGPFFAAAAFIPSAAAPHTLLPAALFATLCTLNCLYIRHWESPPHYPKQKFVPHPHDSFTVVRVGIGEADLCRLPKPANGLRQSVKRLLNPISYRKLAVTTVTLIAATLTITFTSAATPIFRPITASIALAATLLFILHHQRHRLPPTTLRALADLALLTPLLFAFWPQ